MIMEKMVQLEEITLGIRDTIVKRRVMGVSGNRLQSISLMKFCYAIIRGLKPKFNKTKIPMLREFAVEQI